MIETAAASALRWADFPVSADPRPVVLIDRVARVGEGGFVDGDAKTAWLAGAIESLVPLPPGVLDRLGSGGRDQRRKPTVLTITDIEHGEAPFLCDRGPRMLPAFLLSVTGMRRPCTVLDPDCPVWWPDAVEQAGQRGGREAFIAGDDVTIRLPAWGGVGTVFVRAEFEEHPNYVIGRAVTRQGPTPRVVPLVLIASHVNGQLSTRLGGRVLIDTTGEPFAVRSTDTQL